MSGTYTVTATYSGDSNYTGIAGSDDTAYVGPAPLVITASDASMTYGASAPAITATYNGFENGDDPTSLTIQPSCSTAATSSSPVGNYTSSCSGAYDPNYTISYVQGSVAVGPAPLTVTASNGQMTYGGGAPAISPSFSGFKNGDDASSLTTQPTCSTSASSSSQVGSYSSSCAGAYDPNYDISYKDGSVSVGKAPLKITASGGSMTYGGSPPTIGVATYAGFVNGDGPSSLSTKPTCSTDATSSSSVSGSPYPSSCSGASATDYSITYADGSVTVNPAPLKITASDGTMTYGGSPPAITVSSYTGFVNGDDAASLSVQATCSTNATATSPVGSYSSSCTGAYDPDYTISYGYGSVSVGQADLTVTASDASMTYGGTVPTISPEYSGFKNGDSAVNLSTQPSCSTDATGSSPVGSYSSSCSGASAANYDISYVKGTVKVTQAPLTITASNGSMSYGGSPPKITVVSYEGFVNGDTSTSLATQATCSTTASSSSSVSGSPYKSSCSGASAADYTISYVSGSVAVNPIALKVTASNATMAYGGTPPTITVASYSGFVNGDSASSLTTPPQCSTTATSSSAVGSSDPSSCSGAVDPNYTFTYVPGTVTVKPAALTITASSAKVAFGVAPPAITASYSGFVNGDTSASLSTQPTCSTTATSTSAVASYPSTCASAADSNYTITYVAGSITVTQATPTVTVSGANGLTSGPVTISVVVSGASGAAAPTGSVTVTDANSKCKIATLDATGSGTCTLVENASEDGETVTASYSGDTNYIVATGTTTEAVTVATPTVTLSAPTSASAGLITYDVTVAGKGAAPSGSVTITDGTNTCETGPLLAGLGACSLKEASGTYQVVAQYPGDGNYATASASATEVVNETATSLVVSTSTLLYGQEQSALFSVTVMPPPGVAPPSGTPVQLMAGSQVLCVTSPLVASVTTVVDPTLGPVQVPVAIATCHLAPTAVAAGTYNVAANFAGQPGAFVGSVSTPSSVTVESAPTSTVTVLSSPKTTYEGENSEKLTVQVSEPTAGSSFVTGEVIVKSGSTVLCKPTLKAGLATCKLTRAQLPAGQHTIVADFAGSANLLSSSSKPVILVVAKALTTSALSLSRTTVAYGSEQSVTLTARVTVPTGAAPATGTVEVTSGSKRLCVITLVRGKGTCSLSSSELAVGTHQISGLYQGSSQLQASTSPGRSLLVTKAH